MSFKFYLKMIIIGCGLVLFSGCTSLFYFPDELKCIFEQKTKYSSGVEESKSQKNGDQEVITNVQKSIEKGKKVTAFNESQFPRVEITPFPGDGFKKEIGKGIEAEFVVTDKNTGDMEIRFNNYNLTGEAYTFRNAEYRTNSQEQGNPLWFDVIFIPINEEELYIFDKSGHEGYPRYVYIKKNHLIYLEDILKWKLWNTFGKEMFPPLLIEAYPSYLRVEEDNYCCDIVYDTANPEREKYRKVFYLDRETFEILKEEKVQRFHKE